MIRKLFCSILDRSFTSILVGFFLFTFVVMFSVTWRLSDNDGFVSSPIETPTTPTTTNTPPTIEQSSLVPLSATILIPQLLYRKRDTREQELYIYNAMLVRNNIVLLFHNRINHTLEGHPFGSFFNDWLHPEVLFHRVKLSPIVSSAFAPASNPRVLYGLPTHAMEFDCHKIDNQEMEIPRERKAISTVVCPLPTEYYRNVMMKTETDGQRIHEGIHLDFSDNVSFVISYERPTASEDFKHTTRINPPEFFDQKIGVCLAGLLSNGAEVIREIVQYHLSVGVDHVYIQTNTRNSPIPNSPPPKVNVTKFYEEQLSDFIAERRVSLIPGNILSDRSEGYFEHNATLAESGERENRDTSLKIPFLNSCLWYSKWWDTYTIVVDLDEIFVYNHTMKSLWDALQFHFESDKKACQVILEGQYHVFMTNESFNRNLSIAARFPRQKMKAEGWPKSVVHTQRAKFAWLHWAGVCQPVLEEEVRNAKALGLSRKRRKRSEESIQGNSDVLRMLHFRNLFSAREEGQNNMTNTVESEYIWFYENMVKPELTRRCKTKGICPPFVVGAS